MTRAQKAQKIADILEELYPETPVPLDHRDPYTLLLAVLLSAQTTDKKVNEVTPALFDAAPNPRSMVALGADRIREYIREIGLAPTRPRTLLSFRGYCWSDTTGQCPKRLRSWRRSPEWGTKPPP